MRSSRSARGSASLDGVVTVSPVCGSRWLLVGSIGCLSQIPTYLLFLFMGTLLLHCALKIYSFFWCCVGSDRVAGVSVSIGTLDLMRVDGRHAFVVFYGVLGCTPGLVATCRLLFQGACNAPPSL